MADRKAADESQRLYRQLVGDQLAEGGEGTGPHRDAVRHRPADELPHRIRGLPGRQVQPRTLRIGLRRSVGRGALAYPRKMIENARVPKAA